VVVELHHHEAGRLERLEQHASGPLAVGPGRPPLGDGGGPVEPVPQIIDAPPHPSPTAPPMAH
jgi:hypothetical protein